MYYGLETHNLDKLCMEEIPGVSILIHGPDEFPGLSKGYIQVKTGDQPKILLKPVVTHIDDKLKTLDSFTLVCFWFIINPIISFHTLEEIAIWKMKEH